MSSPEDWIDSHLPSPLAYPIKALLVIIYVVAAMLFVVGMTIWTCVAFIYKTPNQMREFMAKIWER